MAGFDWVLLCVIELPYSEFCLLRNTEDWLFGLDFKRLQRMNVKNIRLLEGTISKRLLFAL